MDEEVIGLAEVAEILGMKVSTISYKYAYRPDFPKAFKYNDAKNGKRYWKKAEVLAYKEMRMARAA